jgi:hypothetical protein
MPPDQFRLAARRVLGIPEPSCAYATACGACGASLDITELAALHFPACPGPCALGAGHGDVYGAQLIHSSLKRGMIKVLDDSGCVAVQEPAHLLGQSSLERPADVAVLDYEESNQTLAIDVSCTRLMTNTNLDTASRHPGRVLELAEGVKRNQYEGRTEAHSIQFVPFIMDEYGHIGPSGMAFLSGLALRTATRRRSDKRTMEGVGMLARRLLLQWQGFMTTELHSAVARVVKMLAAKARSGTRL